MLNIEKKNFIIEIETEEKDFGILSIQENDNQMVLVTQKLQDTIKALEESGYQNLNTSEYKYIVHSYIARKDKFCKLVQEHYLIDNKLEIYQNKSMKELRNNLDKVREIGMITETTQELLKTYIPKYAVYQRDVVSIKIPTNLMFGNENRWDYEYLIYPLTDIFNGSIKYNKRMIELLNENIGDNKDLYIDIKSLPTVTNDELLTTFTPNRYRLAMLNYSILSLYTKGYIRILRNLPDNTEIDSNFYDIYQKARMAKSEKLDYIEVIWKDDLTNELTFPKMIKQVTGLKPEEFDAIPLDDADKMLDEIISEIEKLPNNTEGYHIALNSAKALKDYKHLSEKEDFTEVLEKYEEYERKREHSREDIFFMNLNLRCRIEDFVDLYKNTVLSAFINLNIMDFRDSNRPVTISFKRKESQLSMVDDEQIGWMSECIF